MVKITGLDAVKEAIKGKAKKYGSRDSVVMGYRGVKYALSVHENAKAQARRQLMPAGKNPKAQWKFLEQPARELRGEFNKLIKIALKNGASLRAALMVAAYRLKRESQELVPVKTGNLKGSAFVESDKSQLVS